MLFLRAVASICPECLIDLRTIVLEDPQPFLTFAPDEYLRAPNGRANQLRKWCREYHLTIADSNALLRPADWCLMTAYQTGCDLLRSSLASGDRLDWSYPAWGGVRIVTPSQEQDRHSLVFEPDLETEPQYRQRIDKHIERVRSEALASGAVPTQALYRNLQFFEWAARFQVAEHTIARICSSSRTELDRRQVTRTVNEVLQLVGLSRRESPRGRPTTKNKNK